MNNPENTSFVSYIFSLITSNIGDWIVTGIITFFSVKLATKKYYRQNTEALLSEALSNEIRRLMRVDAKEKLPDSSLAVFVEYKGKIEEDMTKKGAQKGDPARQTIVSIGGNSNNTSKTNPRDYGVLGVANCTKYPVLADFQEKKVYYYHWGQVYALDGFVLPDNTDYWGVDIQTDNVDIHNHAVAKVKTHRGAMIALPIFFEGKLVGGITFDVPQDCSAYSPISATASDTEKEEALEKIGNVLMQTNIVTSEIIKIYFKAKRF